MTPRKTMLTFDLHDKSNIRGNHGEELSASLSLVGSFVAKWLCTKAQETFTNVVAGS